MRLSDVKGLVLLWGIPSNQSIGVIKDRTEQDRALHILVPEMRPYCFGLEVAKRLKVEGMKHMYATDNMLGILFFKNKVKEVLFFYKEMTDHEIVGICGSLYVCLLAHVHSIPIKPVQGGIPEASQASSSLDEYIRLQDNDDMLEAADEYVSMDIIR